MPALLLCGVCLQAAQAAGPLEGLVVPFRQVDLSAPVASFIQELKVKEGETVKAGQPLLQLYGKLEELEMKRAKAQLDRREYEARGVKTLYDSKILPEARSMDARADLEVARLNYETAAEQFRLRTLLSPIDGTVAERFRETGEAVAPGQPIFRIVDLSRIIIVCALKADRLGKLAVGQKLVVHLPQADTEPPLQAEVVFIEPRADAAGLFKVKLLADNPEQRIRAGLRAQVELP